jgi:hypothetical protein
MLTLASATVDSAQAPAAAPRLLTEQLNEARLVTLPGNTRPEANAANDRGAVADDVPMPHVLLQLRRSAEQEQSLAAVIDQLHSPTSPIFHKWLSPAEFAQYGPSDADLQVIIGWLQGQGFRVNAVYPSRMVIDFSGIAAQVRTAFHTQIHQFMVKGVQHVANVSDPQIPAALDAEPWRRLLLWLREAPTRGDRDVGTTGRHDQRRAGEGQRARSIDEGALRGMYEGARLRAIRDLSECAQPG